MENCFNGKTIYAGPWNLKSKRAFNAEEINSVSRAEVVQSNYGLSVCFHMVGGGRAFIPLSTKSNAQVGDSVDLTTAQLITLAKSGENDVERVEI